MRRRECTEEGEGGHRGGEGRAQRRREGTEEEEGGHIGGRIEREEGRSFILLTALGDSSQRNIQNKLMRLT